MHLEYAADHVPFFASGSTFGMALPYPYLVLLRISMKNRHGRHGCAGCRWAVYIAEKKRTRTLMGTINIGVCMLTSSGVFVTSRYFFLFVFSFHLLLNEPASLAMLSRLVAQQTAAAATAAMMRVFSRTSTALPLYILKNKKPASLSCERQKKNFLIKTQPCKLCV